MEEYYYRARNRKGQVTKGKIRAESEQAAAADLTQHGLVPVEIVNRKNQSIFKRDFSISRVKARDRAVMARQLSTLIESGIRTVQALNIVLEQTENPKLADILREVSYEVEGGANLSSAMERFPEVFSEFFISMVKSGEHSGRTTEVLRQVADHEERDYELLSKTRSAFIYPAFVLGAMVIMGILMVTFVLPQLVGVFKESNVDLPLITRMLIGLSGFLTDYWWFVLGFILFAAYLVFAYVRTDEGRYNLHGILLRMPVFGKLLKKIYLARFSASMEILVGGDIQIVQALLIARDILTNRIYRGIIEKTAEEVKNGGNISTALERYPEIPLMLSQMIAVGEKTGELSKSFEVVQRFYRREVDEAFNNLSQLIEPVVIIVLGVGVALLLVAVLMPMYQLVQVVS